MIYWIVFLFLEYLLLLLFTSSKREGARTWLLFLIIIIAVYFAGFRDCLGMDYDGYREHCERERYIGDAIWFFNEPIYELIRNFCASTHFSAVVFFLAFAALTSAPALYYYSKSDNFFLSGFIYLTYTGLYLFSFNVVRQFAAAGILMIGTYYLLKGGKKNKLLFIAVVFISALIHKSALFFLPVLFLLKKDFNVVVILILLILSFVIPFENIFGISQLSALLGMMDYDIYLDNSSVTISKYSLSNLYLHLMLIPLLFNKGKILKMSNSERYVFSIKMFVVYLICNNLSANGIPIAYRTGILFAMYIPIALSIIPRLFKERLVGYIAIIIPFLILFFAIGMSNSIVVPDRMLPLNSIFDSEYIKYR